VRHGACQIRNNRVWRAADAQLDQLEVRDGSMPQIR
jgi:hypothetical protein